MSLFMFSCGGATESTSTNNNTNNSSNDTPSTDTPAANPVKISGTVKGLADGTKVFFDRKTTEAVEILSSVPVKAGEFELNSNVPQAGIYRIRLGANYVWLALKGKEELVIDANVESSKINQLKIEGSPQSQELMNVIMQNPQPKELASYLDSKDQSQSLVNLFLVERLDPNAYFEQYEKVMDQLAATHPDWPYTRAFASKVTMLKQKMNQQPIKVGSPIPEISLKGPNGETYSISQLKGKVVLVDFWASWCGPCRRENPNVVRVYDKYNAKGFEVFSISLDGLDDRRVAMMQNNPQMLNQQMDQQRQRWRQAITQDQLKWPYHVSELRGWSTSVAQQFGVNSIPRALLIDRNGVIRYMDGLRGPALEQKVKELL